MLKSVNCPELYASSCIYRTAAHYDGYFLSAMTHALLFYTSLFNVSAQICITTYTAERVMKILLLMHVFSSAGDRTLLCML